MTDVKAGANVRLAPAGYRRNMVQTRLQLVSALWSAWLIGGFVAAVLIWPEILRDPTPMRHMVVGGITPMINIWHAVFHFGTGIVGLLAAARRRTAVVFAIAAGTIYLGIGAVAFSGSNILGPFGMMPYETFGNTLHVLEGLLMFVVGLVSLVGRDPSRS
jgi:Domain of unknown function (DUF4383)